MADNPKNDPRQSFVIALSQHERDLLRRLLAKVDDAADPTAPSGEEMVLVELADRLYRARQDRRHFMLEDLLGEPSWDILLALYCSEARGQPITIVGLCAAARVPQTTALRWFKELERVGMLSSEPHPLDRRAHVPTFTAAGRENMRQYLIRLQKRYFKLA